MPAIFQLNEGNILKTPPPPDVDTNVPPELESVLLFKRPMLFINLFIYMNKNNLFFKRNKDKLDIINIKTINDVI
uniref:Uncharacterized protein n=1 Tax=viral metagenome TaxID=1070528 RepID=A0A6C0D8Q4_9ZZZZ